LYVKPYRFAVAVRGGDTVTAWEYAADERRTTAATGASDPPGGRIVLQTGVRPAACMEHVSIDDVEPQHLTGDVDRRGLSEPLSTSDLAMNYYALEPGESFSGALHAHLDQEEVFYVLEGEATFEHMSEATGEPSTTTVTAGEAVRFAPGEFQTGRNETDGPVRALALGAPRESTEGRVPQPCPECGDSDAMAFRMGEDGPFLECPECSATTPLAL
jgi:uncharacterized cupin superfamily protein